MFLKKIIISGFKSFADKIVINLDKGITGVVGPNGSGKTTVVRVASRALAPTAGNVSLAGVDPYAVGARAAPSGVSRNAARKHSLVVRQAPIGASSAA